MLVALWVNRKPIDSDQQTLEPASDMQVQVRIRASAMRPLQMKKSSAERISGVHSA